MVSSMGIEDFARLPWRLYEVATEAIMRAAKREGNGETS
jgi:hypothetical protein